MKFQPNKQYTTIAVYAFAVIVVTILFYEGLKNFGVLWGGLSRLSGFVQPVIYGFVFAFLLNPLLRLVEGRWMPVLTRSRFKAKTNRSISILITYLIALIVIGLFVAIVVPQLILSIEQIFVQIPSYIRMLENFYANINQYVKDFQILSQGTESEALISNLMGMTVSTMEGLLEKSYEYITSLVPALVTATTRFTTRLINLVLGIIISIYFLADREKLFAQSRKITSAIFPEHVCQLLYDIIQDTHRLFSGFITGKVIDSVIIGILCFIVMWIANWPYAVLISVIIGVTNIIPYFGPFIGAVPSAIIIFIDSPVQCFWFLLFILLLQQFDGNILGPKILGDSTGLSPLWVVFAILLFSGLMGVIGMFIGVPLFAVIYSLIKRLIAFLLARKDKPTDTRQYASDKNPLIK